MREVPEPRETRADQRWRLLRRFAPRNDMRAGASRAYAGQALVRPYPTAKTYAVVALVFGHPRRLTRPQC